MKKVKFLSAEYVPSNSIELLEESQSVAEYLKKGYYVKKKRNNYCLLVKSAKLIVTVQSDGIYKFNMKKEICEYYGKNRISMKTIGKFCQNVRSGKIKLYLDENENIIIE